MILYINVESVDIRIKNTVVTRFVTRVRAINLLEWIFVVKPVSECFGYSLVC